MFIQSENTELPALKKRFDEFRQQFALFLPKLEPTSVEQIKNSLLVQLQQKPQNMPAEGAMYFNDFLDGNYEFNTRQELIDELRKANIDSIKTTYLALLQSNSFNILIQQRGEKFNKTDFALPEKFKPVSSSQEFQTILQQ